MPSKYVVLVTREHFPYNTGLILLLATESTRQGWQRSYNFSYRPCVFGYLCIFYHEYDMKLFLKNVFWAFHMGKPLEAIEV